MAQVDSNSAAGLDLPACSVLPINVLVLRVPHLYYQARRTRRHLRRRPSHRSASRCGSGRWAITRLPHPFRLRHSDDHDARNLCRPRRRAARKTSSVARWRSAPEVGDRLLEFFVSIRGGVTDATQERGRKSLRTLNNLEVSLALKVSNSMLNGFPLPTAGAREGFDKPISK